MKPTVRRLVATWIVGAFVGTAAIAITSPLLVRSYAPLHADSVRGVWTLPEGHTYRWRSEGYADTKIGPLGMPGKTSIANRDDGIVRVALWGDSQAEGVCVADDEKLFAQAEQLSSQQSLGSRLEVFPFARSGEDADDWVTQMPAVQRELAIDLHVLLVVDLPDLIAATDAPVPPPSESDIAKARAAMAARLPAFVIQAARHLLTESDGATPRKLRFSIGPVDLGSGTDRRTVSVSDSQQSSRAQPLSNTDWLGPIRAIRRASEKPVVILYAPVSPQIVGGKVMVQDAWAADFTAMKAVAQTAGLHVVDARRQLRQSARQGRWPHGFHNGFIGSGHLNADGNSVVAMQLISAAVNVIERGN